MFANDYSWYEAEEDKEYIFSSVEDWEGEDDAARYDWGTVCYDADLGSGLWGAWWTSAENNMCFGDRDFESKEEAMEHIEKVLTEG